VDKPTPEAAGLTPAPDARRLTPDAQRLTPSINLRLINPLRPVHHPDTHHSAILAFSLPEA